MASIGVFHFLPRVRLLSSIQNQCLCKESLHLYISLTVFASITRFI
jgi:hypothetical protein